MKRQCRLSNVTKDYLATFHCIFENMIQAMKGAEFTNSISYNFIVQMIPHHQAAIDMSRNILQYTTCVSLQDIAMGIVEEQTKSMEDMRKIVTCCGKYKNTQKELSLYQGKADQVMQMMISDMEHSCVTNQINADFLWEMIPHHQGAIAMAENTICFTICPELKPILCAIIRSQKKGVMQMQQLLRCVGCRMF